MEYQVNFETLWIVGIWSADRGTRAKGVLAINNSNQEILNNFISASLKSFDIDKSRFRSRTIKGYGVTQEVYFTRLPARKFVERLLGIRLEFSEMQAYAYLAGRFDGDGSVDAKGSILCFYYGNKEKEELQTDKKLVEKFGYSTSFGTAGKKALRLRILKPRHFASKIVPYVKHEEKKKKLLMLMSKRPYKA